MALSNDTEYLVLNQLTILAYDSFRFADNFVARFDMNCVTILSNCSVSSKNQGCKRFSVVVFCALLSTYAVGAVGAYCFGLGDYCYEVGAYCFK